MSVSVRINGRVFSLSWEQFEKALSRLAANNSVEILEIRNGGAYVAA